MADSGLTGNQRQHKRSRARMGREPAGSDQQHSRFFSRRSGPDRAGIVGFLDSPVHQRRGGFGQAAARRKGACRPRFRSTTTCRTGSGATAPAAAGHSQSLQQRSEVHGGWRHHGARAGRLETDAATAGSNGNGGPKPRQIQFAVSNTGIGVPESQRELIFQPFRQADGSVTRRFGGPASAWPSPGSARGKYIARLDQDDYRIDSQKLEKQVAYLDAHPNCTVVGGGVIVVDGEGKNAFAISKKKMTRKSGRPRSLRIPSATRRFCSGKRSPLPWVSTKGSTSRIGISGCGWDGTALSIIFRNTSSGTQ